MMPLPILLAVVFLGTANCSSKIVHNSFFLQKKKVCKVYSQRASSSLGDIVKSRCVKGTRAGSERRDGGEKGKLAMIIHKFSFPPRKP